MDSVKYCNDYTEKLFKNIKTEKGRLNKLKKDLNGLIYIKKDFVVSFGHNLDKKNSVNPKIKKGTPLDFQRLLLIYEPWKKN